MSRSECRSPTTRKNLRFLREDCTSGVVHDPVVYPVAGQRDRRRAPSSIRLVGLSVPTVTAACVQSSLSSRLSTRAPHSKSPLTHMRPGTIAHPMRRLHLSPGRKPAAVSPLCSPGHQATLWPVPRTSARIAPIRPDTNIPSVRIGPDRCGNYRAHIGMEQFGIVSFFPGMTTTLLDSLLS
jgi:hypothetical protein